MKDERFDPFMAMMTSPRHLRTSQSIRQLIFTFLVSQAQTTSLGDPRAVVSRCNYHIQNLAISMADDYALTQAAPLSLLTGAVLGCLPRAWSLVSSSRWPAIEVFPRRRFLK
jgi:hypothetical protein